MKYRYHISIDCEGALNNPKCFKGCITNDEGKTLTTVKEVRDFFREQIALGRKVIPCGECDNYDYQIGCKGHAINENENILFEDSVVMSEAEIYEYRKKY